MLASSIVIPPDAGEVLAELWLEGRVIPKKRARTFKQGKRTITTLPDNYRKWKQSAIASLRKQSRYHRLNVEPPIEVYAWFLGFAAGDTDNLKGAIMDALVGAAIIPDDSPTYSLGGGEKIIAGASEK